MERKGMPLVSVVVPVYKAEKHIAKCVESILNQTHCNLELLLVDDGSPDQSGKICDEYAAKDPRVLVFHTENGGVSHARNTGIDHATGEYLVFVDSDDWVSPQYIQNLLPRQGEDLVHSGYIRVVDGQEEDRVFWKEHSTLKAQWKEQFAKNWSEGALMAPWGNSYKRRIIEQHGIRFNTEIDIAEDELFNLEYLIHCEQVRYSENCDYFYVTDNTGSLINRHHTWRTLGQMKVARAKEKITGKPEYRIRWSEWKIAVEHHRKWRKLSKGKKRQEIDKCLKDTYRNGYFRESISYIRKNGALDEKVETWFMSRLLHPLYPGIYQILVCLSRLKGR